MAGAGCYGSMILFNASDELTAADYFGGVILLLASITVPSGIAVCSALSLIPSRNEYEQLP